MKMKGTDFRITRVARVNLTDPPQIFCIQCRIPIQERQKHAVFFFCLTFARGAQLLMMTQSLVACSASVVSSGCLCLFIVVYVLVFLDQVSLGYFTSCRSLVGRWDRHLQLSLWGSQWFSFSYSFLIIHYRCHYQSGRRLNLNKRGFCLLPQWCHAWYNMGYQKFCRKFKGGPSIYFLRGHLNFRGDLKFKGGPTYPNDAMGLDAAWREAEE
jgi:hypothetical protein